LAKYRENNCIEFQAQKNPTISIKSLEGCG